MATPSKMQRGLNPEASAAYTLTLNPKQIEIVNRLYSEGLHGNSPAEVVKRIFCDGCAIYKEQK